MTIRYFLMYFYNSMALAEVALQTDTEVHFVSISDFCQNPLFFNILNNVYYDHEISGEAAEQALSFRRLRVVEYRFSISQSIVIKISGSRHRCSD